MVLHEGAGTAFPSPFLVDGARAAARDISEHGGIKGHPVEAVECNDAQNPNVAANCARTAVTDGDIAVVGSTVLEQSVFPVLQQSGVPWLGEPNSIAAYTSKISFPLGGGALGPAFSAAQEVALAGAKHIALLYVDAGAASAELLALAGFALKPYNLTLERSVPVPAPSPPDVSSLVASATRGDIDGLLIFETNADAVKLIKAVDQAGLRSKLKIGLAGEADQLTQTMGSDADGIYAGFETKLVTQTSDSSVQRFIADMKAIGGTPSESAMLGWAPVVGVAQVAQTLPALTSAALLAALPSATVTTGLYPPVDFSKPSQGIPGITRLFNTNSNFAVVQDGKWVATKGNFVDVLQHVSGS